MIVVRATRPSDRTALGALIGRCSNEVLYRRFHGAVGSIMERELDRIARSTSSHRSWLAIDGTAVRGTATLATGRDGAAEAAFLVEDAWLRRGVGRALFRALAAEARSERLDAVTAWVQADNERARRFFRSVVPGARTTFAGGGELQILVPVQPVGIGAGLESTIYQETA